MTINEDFDREPEQLVTVLDQARHQALQKVALLTSVRGAAQARELARTAATHSQGSSEVAREAAALLGHAVIVAGLADDLGTERFFATVKPDAAAVGRLVGAPGRRPSGLKVVITTDKGAEVATVNVDRSGAFLVKPLKPDQQTLVAEAAKIVFTVVDGAGKEVHRTAIDGPGAADQTLVVNLDVGPALDRRASAGVLRPEVIPNLDDDRIVRLREAGIRNMAALADASPDDLRRILEVGAREAGTIARSAKKVIKDAE